MHTTSHPFRGKWITTEEFCRLQPRNVFHRQLEPLPLNCSEHRNRHILFRRRLHLAQAPQRALLYISADDFYKLYVNGAYVAEGPAPSYHMRYNYNTVDLTPYLKAGDNLIAVHTLYQGLINRVWQSGDWRHGLLCDLVIDGVTALCSDESFRVAYHTAYTELGVTGKHQTQFLERYDTRAPEVGFERPDFDDASWKNALVCRFDDHSMKPQASHRVQLEQVAPKKILQKFKKYNTFCKIWKFIGNLQEH